MAFPTINPATGETLKTYEHHTSSETEKALQKAFESAREFKSKSVSMRQQELRALAATLRAQAPQLAQTVTLEMGKPITDSLAEIEKCATAFDYYAENLERFLAPENVVTSYSRSQIVKDPIGPVLAIMPWNFPVWQAVRFAAPAVGIGNPIVLKHADQTAGTAEKMQEIFDSVSKGLMVNLRMEHSQVSQVIADPRIRAVTLTGSTRAGKIVAEQAARHLKKTVLELGGSDAYVVFADSDVEKAGQICARARMVNNGQSCVAAKRFLVEKKVLPQFLQAFQGELQKLKIGDPLKKETQVGSLASKKFQTQLLKQCETLAEQGGKKIFESSSDFNFSAPGAYFPSRVYLAPKASQFAFQEEFFGPVALVFDFESEAEALELCNRSSFGLGGAVFSKDLVRADRFARQMEAGFVAINEQVKSDPRLPFGGVKDSGYGRELGLYGFNEFCNIKTMGFGI